MSLTTTVFRRESPAGVPETITVMASLDDEGAEIRVIHERDGEVVEDTIPHYGPDPGAGRRWLDDQHAACLAAGYRVVERS